MILRTRKKVLKLKVFNWWVSERSQDVVTSKIFLPTLKNKKVKKNAINCSSLSFVLSKWNSYIFTFKLISISTVNWLKTHNYMNIILLLVH